MKTANAAKTKVFARIEALGSKINPEWVLRVALGIVYLWFGALKLVGVSPVLELVRQSYPLLGILPLYLALTLFEIGLGVWLLSGVRTRWAAAAVVFHLLGTFGVLVFAPQISFYPWFPFLTMDGEFVIKNLILMAAAISLLVGVGRSSSRLQHRPRKGILTAFVVAGAIAVMLAFPYLHQSLRAATAQSTVLNDPPKVHADAGMIYALTRASPIVVRGVVVNHCRLLGCWLIIRDRTGTLFVNLVRGALNPRTLANGTRVQLAGHLGITCQGRLGFIASSLKVIG